MKSFIIGIAIFILGIIFTVFQHDYNMHQRYLYSLKFVAEEAAAAAAQYNIKVKYAEGKVVFNQVEGIKAAEYIITKQLKLDNNFVPLANSYWQNKVTYELKFFDDENISYPYLYEQNNPLFSFVVTEPTVIVTINTGKPRYKTFTSLPDSIRIAAHEWQER